MSELDEFKQFLGPLAAPYTDEQLLQLRRDFHIAADLLLDLYLEVGDHEEDDKKAFDRSGAGALRSKKYSAKGRFPKSTT